ncbi:hypothetical protein EUTSA_v10012341mg, partial [Eutrema salsugineum]
MRKRKQQVIEENLILSSTSDVGYFDPIPIDLVINNIFSRLSGKSMGKCRCVSKLWSSILRHPNFNQLFRFNSLDPPTRFLFTFFVGENLFYFSSPQPQKLNENLSLPLVIIIIIRIPPKISIKVCRPVHGLVCSQFTGKDYTEAVIYNPITGESVTSPTLRKEDLEWKAECYFGYDPIENEFKVLCKWGVQHQVLTLETGNLLWRKIQCCKPYYFLSEDGICINGVLYYTAMKFSFINIDQEYLARKKITSISARSILINYKGNKLGVIDYDKENYLLELSVLEDAKERKWSTHIHPLP